MSSILEFFYQLHDRDSEMESTTVEKCKKHNADADNCYRCIKAAQSRKFHRENPAKVKAYTAAYRARKKEEASVLS